MPADIQTVVMGRRKEFFWPVISNVLSGWSNGFLYVRFADDRKPQDNVFTASYGDCFTITGSELTFRDLHTRGSRMQFRIRRGSSGITIDNCLLMHGRCRIRIDQGVSRATVKNFTLTAGFIRNDLFQFRSSRDMRGGLLYLIFKYNNIKQKN